MVADSPGFRELRGTGFTMESGRGECGLLG